MPTEIILDSWRNTLFNLLLPPFSRSCKRNIAVSRNLTSISLKTTSFGTTPLSSIVHRVKTSKHSNVSKHDQKLSISLSMSLSTTSRTSSLSQSDLSLCLSENTLDIGYCDGLIPSVHHQPPSSPSTPLPHRCPAGKCYPSPNGDFACFAANSSFSGLDVRMFYPFVNEFPISNLEDCWYAQKSNRREIPVEKLYRIVWSNPLKQEVKCRNRLMASSCFVLFAGERERGGPW